MSGTTIDALTKLPARLAGDGIHVALTIVIDLDGRPCLWISDRRGHPHPITAYKLSGEVPPERRPTVAGWGVADLALAAEYLSSIERKVAYRRVRSLREAHDRALAEIDERDARRLAAALADPYHCVCRRRFATQRGLAQHIARSSIGTHAEAVAS